MKKLCFSLLVFLTASYSFGQNLQNANWCFGVNARVDFNFSPPNPMTSAIGFNNPGSSAAGSSVSDDNGQLLFYTDGLTVWNKTNNIMLNGQSLYGFNDGSTRGNNSLIVLKPNHPNIYYIFSLAATARYGGSPDPVGKGGLHYSVVDMSLDNNLGAIVLKNISLRDHNLVPVDYDFTPNDGGPNQLTIGSTMTSALHNDQDKIWVSIFPHFDNSCLSDIVRYSYSFLVTEIGINNLADGVSPAPYISVPLSNSNYIVNNCQEAGVMKISSDGQRLAHAEYTVNLYNFNNQTGAVTFNNTIYTPPPFPPYRGAGSGVEFSPNSQLIYFSELPSNVIQSKPVATNSAVKYRGALYQYNINEQSIIEIRIPDVVVNGTSSASFPVSGPYGLQLAIDNKIYLCAYGNLLELWNWLGVIEDPDVSGTGCNFSPYGIQLLPGTFHNASLPQWVHKIKESWPKIYEAGESNGFKIDNNGNIFSAMSLVNAANNINHSGVLPNVYGDQYVHYNKVSGYTNWVSTDLVVGLTLNSGIVNFLNHSFPNPYPLTNNYRNGNSGVLVNGPSNAPANEELLVENNGGLLTQAGYNLKTYSPSGILVSSISIASIPGYFLAGNYFTSIATPPIYNPATNNVYMCHVYYSGTLGNIWRVGIYHFDPVTFALSPINTPGNNQIHGPIVQVNTSENIFVYDPVNHILEEYNWQTYQYTPLTINNFLNSSLELVGRSNQLVEDRIIIKNTNQQLFYCINTGGPFYTATKIPYTPPSNTSQFYNYYFFDGSDVFITGEYQGTGFSIGSQTMPLLGSGSAFITKFPLSDFSFRPISDNKDSRPGSDNVNPASVQKNDTKDKNVDGVINLILSPNPAKQTLQVTLNQANGKEASLFFISITNAAGIKVLTTFSNKNIITLDISQLKAGIYYVSRTNDKKNIATKAFLKD